MRIWWAWTMKNLHGMGFQELAFFTASEMFVRAYRHALVEFGDSLAINLRLRWNATGTTTTLTARDGFNASLTFSEKIYFLSNLETFTEYLKFLSKVESKLPNIESFCELSKVFTEWLSVKTMLTSQIVTSRDWIRDSYRTLQNCRTEPKTNYSIWSKRL